MASEPRAPFTVTLKTDGGFDAPWIVISADSVEEVEQRMNELCTSTAFEAIGRAAVAMVKEVKVGANAKAVPEAESAAPKAAPKAATKTKATTKAKAAAKPKAEPKPEPEAEPEQDSWEAPAAEPEAKAPEPKAAPAAAGGKRRPPKPAWA